MFFDTLDILGMMNTYNSRKVDRYEQDGLLISTCFVTDGKHDYETAIRSPLYNDNDFVVVEAYDSEEDARAGHRKWVDNMTTNPPEKLVDCGNSKISQWIEIMGGNMEFLRQDIRKGE